MAITVKDVQLALDDMTNGRIVKGPGDWASGKNPYVTTKTSGIPGKVVTETPGLVWGDPEMVVRRIAVMTTLTESAIELAAATGVNALVVHHTIADAANSGGVLLKYYLGAYNLACFELHEAFHGTHPGIPWLHGHKPYYVTTALRGEVGKVAYVGEALPGINTLGDMTSRLDRLLYVELDEGFLNGERTLRGCDEIDETSVAARARILVGDPETPIHKIIHMFPHTGFNCDDLAYMKHEFPEADTLMATISRVYPGHALIEAAKELNMSFVCGNSHAMEVFENGLPMAYALRESLPGTDVVMFRERVTSIPLASFGSPEIRAYGEEIAANYLHRK